MFDLVDLVRGAEAVEEMDKGNAGLDGRKMRDAGKVHDLLYASAGQKSKPCLAAVHDVRVVSENRKSMGSDGTAGHMKNARKAFACDPVHGRDHQHKTLGRGKAGCKGTGFKSTVNRADGAGFGLHFHKTYPLSKKILFALCCPDVGFSSHGRRGGNRIDGGDFGEGVGDIGCRFVAVDSYKLLFFVRQSVHPPVFVRCFANQSEKVM